MLQKITRYSRPLIIDITATLGTTPVIDISECATGRFVVQTDSLVTSITWYASCSVVEDFQAAYFGGSAVTQTVAADQSHEIPAGLFGAKALKAVGNAAGLLYVFLKS